MGAGGHFLLWHGRALTFVVSQMGWISLTTIFGMPVLIRLRHLVKQARIESIMKGN
jgi:hypothetical protein